MPALTTVLAQTGRPFPDWSWFSSERNVDELQGLLVQHVQLTALALVFGLLIALPLAVAAVRWRRLYTPLLGFTGVLFTVPSAALFVLLLAVLPQRPPFGLGMGTSLIGLTIYTLLILFRNTVAGLDSVPSEVTEAATAMGYTRRRQLLRVEFPLALPVIMAGVRIAAVTTIGLVTVTAFIGQGGLGRLFLSGFRTQYTMEVAIGLVLSIVLAVVVDLALVGTERWLTPWSQARRAQS
ncbi:MAG TPA: ABC transporter permease [Euzebyales bacterium]|nr:ABC transporter permease [Euzebyales bacterium]